MKLDQLLGQLQAQSPQLPPYSAVEETGRLSQSAEASTSSATGTTTTSSVDSTNGDKMHVSTKERPENNSSRPFLPAPNIGLSLPWLLQGLMSAALPTAPIPTPIPTSASSTLASGNGNGLDSTSAPVPLSPKEAAQGILAVGGCRQCARTFTDRLELIHHFVDHFPHYFYSFEPLKRSSPQLGMPDGSRVAATMPTPAITDRLPKPTAYSEAATPTSQQMPFATSFDFAAMLGLRNLGAATLNGGSEVRTKAPSRPMTEKSQKIAKRKPSSAGLREEVGSKSVKMGDAASLADRADSSGGGIELPYHMCPHCCLTFSDGGVYQQHLTTHDSMQDDSSTGMNLTLQKTIRCKFCDARFSNPRLLAEHERLHCHVCPLCEKTFTTMFDLNLHAGTHTGFTYDCKDCGRCFPCRKSLAEHNKIHRVLVSSEEPLAKCQVPGQDVATSPAIAICPDFGIIGNSSHLSPSTTSSSDNSIVNGSTPNNSILNPYFNELFDVGGARKRRVTKAPKNCRVERPHRIDTLIVTDDK